MSKRPKPGSAVERVDELTREVDRISLKSALGLVLSEGELDFVGPIPLKADFTREEVIDLLGDGANGIPRMLPVDVALGRLGLAVVRALPDGSAQRLAKEFPKAWAAREKADRAIALYVAKTYREVPKGWYPDRERLMMPDVVGDAERAAGVPDVVPGSRPLLEQGVTELRFDLVPGELKLAGYQMWHRRRLAGMAPCVGDGLVFGYWDDVFSGYDVAAPCFRGIEMALLALECMVLRDIGVAHLFDAGRRNPERLACTEGPYAIVYQSFAGTMYFASRVGPGQPVRTFGGGLARRYQMEVARPGAAWSSRPVRERPEASTELEGFGMRSLVAEDVAGDPDLPEDYVPGARLDPPWTEWAERFASA